MARPSFIPRYEEDESTIKNRMLDRISDEWRKEPGDFIHDAVAPSPLEVKQLQANQDNILKNGFAQFAEGEYLDYKLSEVGLSRGQATANKRQLTITADAGVVIPAGHILSTVVLDIDGNPIEFATDSVTTFAGSGSLDVNVTCVLTGIISNVPNGSEFILSPPIPGVRSIADKGTTIPGVDTESDESAWERYDFKVKNPDTGGNKNDYIRWALEVEGVGKAKCIPRWDGNGTVKVVIVDTTYSQASPVLVNEVQEYLDPGSTGLGDGKAPCGAKVTVIAASILNVNITATVAYYSGYSASMVKPLFQQAVSAYLREIAFQATPIPVAIAKISSILMGTEGVQNHANLKINGVTTDLPVGPEQVAVLGVVTI